LNEDKVISEPLAVVWLQEYNVARDGKLTYEDYKDFFLYEIENWAENNK
jgi:hypothetical protein